MSPLVQQLLGVVEQLKVVHLIQASANRCILGDEIDNFHKQRQNRQRHVHGVHRVLEIDGEEQVGHQTGEIDAVEDASAQGVQLVAWRRVFRVQPEAKHSETVEKISGELGGADSAIGRGHCLANCK